MIVGDGPDRARLEELARERGLDGRARFAGRVSRTPSSPISTRAASPSTTRRSTRTSEWCPYEAFLSREAGAHDDRRRRPARGRARRRDGARRRARRRRRGARGGWLRDHRDEAAAFGRAGKALAARGHLGSRDREAARVKVAYFSPMPPERAGSPTTARSSCRRCASASTSRSSGGDARGLRAARTSRSTTSGTTRTPTAGSSTRCGAARCRRPARLRPPPPRRRHDVGRRDGHGYLDAMEREHGVVGRLLAPRRPRQAHPAALGVARPRTSRSRRTCSSTRPG